MDYEADLQIDPDQLDVEWLEQANRFMKYAEASADADAEVKRINEKIKNLQSELTLDAHQDPTIMGKDIKPTVANVEAYYREHDNYKKLKDQVIDAEHDADVLRNAVFAFHQRKAALEQLVTLHGQQYFAGPTEPRNLGLEFEKRSRHGIASKKVKAGTKRSRST